MTASRYSDDEMRDEVARFYGEPLGRPAWSGRYAQRMAALTIAEYGDRCHLCGEPGADSADHLIPRSKGGSDGLENLRPAHRLCNSQRGAKDLPTRANVVDARGWFGHD